VGGGVVTGGALVIAVDDDATSTLGRITDLVWNLQSSSHGVQKLADTLAAIFVPAVATIAVLAAAGYLLTGAGATAAVLVGLTVLIVSCPCALGLATPLAVASSVRAALDRGIVVFDDTVFERLREVDTVVFDKTGTLTTGRMEVLDADGPDEAFALAAALERRSSHPVAAAITKAFGGGGAVDDTGTATDGGETMADDGTTERTATQPGGRVTEFESHATGVSGVVDGTEVLVGRPDLFVERGWELPGDIEARAEEVRAFGRLPVVVGRDGRAEGVAVVGDEPREGWEETLGNLEARGIGVVVLTGDDERAAEFFADHPAVDEVFARVPPEGKAETVRRLSAEGKTAMVGDGTNDAPALARADLGIALGSGTALAADAADVAIVTDDLRSIETVFDLSRAAGRRVKQNIGWAFGYNAVAIPLAVTGLLNPLFAAVAMASSSLLVVTNSARRLLD
ncbi:MAG: heavy metal translocating P-type ATPase, partial [Haloarculaceae archaeon]